MLLGGAELDGGTDVVGGAELFGGAELVGGAVLLDAPAEMGVAESSVDEHAVAASSNPAAAIAAIARLTRCESAL